MTKDVRNFTADEVHHFLREKAADQWRDIAAAFRAFDKDGNSVVTKKELKKVLHRFNLPIGKEEFNKLWKMWVTLTIFF